MHIQQQRPMPFSIRGYDANGVLINDSHYRSSILISPEGVLSWEYTSLANLPDEAFARLVQNTPELLLIGQKKPDLNVYPALAARLSALRIGCEIMQFDAACRTFNLLLAEGRKLHFLLLF